jgi:hypothetical protein
MAHDPNDNPFAPPYGLTQNPAPNPATQGQDYFDERQQLVNDIMAAFRAVLPSNYVAATNGPWYSLQFQAMAEQLADIQISATEVTKDSSWDFTRTDFLWQMLGTYVFPGATDKSGIPQINGDLDYREFLHRMVTLLLMGATKAAIEGGLEALDPDIIATVIERYLETPPRDPDGAYTIDDQFTMDILIEGPTGSEFPSDPFLTQQNAALVIEALKPAHVLYTYAYLFRDAFGTIADDANPITGEASFVLDLDSYYYDDTRKYCLGAKAIVGTGGETLAGRVLFSDPSLSFRQVRIGAVLKVTSGVNVGQYRVVATQALVSGADATPRSYTTSYATSGTLTATSDDVVEDTSTDWGAAPLDATITILDGPNTGTYRLSMVLGPTGGPVGDAGVSGTQVRLSQSILKVERRMVDVATGQSYSVDVDRLGVRVPQPVAAEDASWQFYL